jgi:branched-chain amino acid aminotransferase
VYAADEVFITGTFAGLSAVKQVDGRMIGKGDPVAAGPMIKRLQQLYLALIESQT